MSKIKVCFVISEDWYFISHRFDLAKKFIDNNFNVSLISNFSKYQNLIKEAGIKINNINFRRSKINIINDIYNIVKINRIISKNNYRIVHAVGIKPILITSISCLFKKNLSLVCAFAGMGTLFTSKTILNYIYKFIFIKIIKLISKKKNYYFLVQNFNDKDILIKLLKINQKKVFLVPGSGINTNYYSFKFKNNLENKNISILMHSRILIEKGVREFFQVAKILKNKKPNFKFILIGKIDKQNPSALRLNDLLEWNKEPNFKWIDYKEDIRSYIYQADISCLPSYREGLPKSILEDCSCGTPVICSDIPGCNTVIKNDFNGQLIKIKSVNSLLDAILTLANDNEKRLKYANRSRELIEKSFSIEIIYESMNKVYQKIL